MATARRRLVSASDFSAVCTSSDHVGRFVYLYAPNSVRTVDLSDLDKVQTVGVIISKSSDTDCVVRRRGEVIGLFSGLSPGKRVMISETGQPAHSYTRPTTGRKWLQWVGIATTTESVMLEFDAPFGIRP